MPRRPGSIDVDQIDFSEAVSQNVVFSGSVKMANLGPKGNTLIIDADGQVSGSDFITIDAENNRIGVFTRTPQEHFHIHGNNATLRLGNGTNSGEHSVKLELSEQTNGSGEMNYGFSVGYNGASNDFEIRRYQNGTAGTNIMTINRASNLTTLRNDLDVGGTVDITGSLKVTGSTHLGDDVYISGNQLKVSSTGPTSLYLQADTDNVTETDTAFIKMTQDGQYLTSYLGYTPANTKDPENNTLTDGLANSLVLACHNYSPRWTTERSI